MSFRRIGNWKVFGSRVGRFDFENDYIMIDIKRFGIGFSTYLPRVHPCGFLGISIWRFMCDSKGCYSGRGHHWHKEVDVSLGQVRFIYSVNLGFYLHFPSRLLRWKITK